MKMEPVLIKKGYKFYINQPFFTSLLIISSKTEYKYLPRSINKTPHPWFVMDVLSECEIDYDLNDLPQTYCELLRMVIDKIKPMDCYFSSVKIQLEKLTSVIVNHYRLYDNRITTERLNYKLF